MMLSTWLPRSATGIGFLLRRPQRSSADGVVAFSPVRFRPSGLASSPTGALSLGGGAGGLAGAPPRGSSLGANQRARPDAHGARAESPSLQFVEERLGNVVSPTKLRDRERVDGTTIIIIRDSLVVPTTLPRLAHVNAPQRRLVKH
jgi:hypothetical protein